MLRSVPISIEWRITIMKETPSAHEPQGNSWQFYFIVSVILVGVIGLVGKVLGLF